MTRQVKVPEVLYSAGVPVVLLNCFSHDRRFPSVVPAEVVGGHSATQALLDARAFQSHMALPLVRWVPESEPGATLVEVDRLKEPRDVLAESALGTTRVMVGGDRRLRALWTFVAARRGLTAAALLDSDQAGTVRPEAQVRKLSMASERSTDRG